MSDMNYRDTEFDCFDRIADECMITAYHPSDCNPTIRESVRISDCDQLGAMIDSISGTNNFYF